MEAKIAAYLAENKVLSMATAIANQPYCATCFYAYDKVNGILIFSSENHTQHIEEGLQNSSVAGTIYTEVTTVAKIQGIQFKGDFIHPEEEQAKQFYSVYYERFPFARAKPAPIWGIQLNWIKMTDNTLGFGKKLEWERL